MELSFVFTSESNFTLFDEMISAISDHDKGVKLIAKKDMLQKGHDELSYMPSSFVKEDEDIEASYTFVDNCLDLNKTIVEIEATIYHIDKMGLLLLSHGGRVALSGKKDVQVLMVSEAGEEDSSIAHEHEFCGHWVVIRIFMATPNRLVIMFDDKELFLDLPENMSKGVMIHGFLGRMCGTKANIHSIKTYDRSSLDHILSARMSKAVMSEPVVGELKATEEEKAELTIVQQANRLKGEWKSEVMDDLESYKGTKQESELMDSVNDALKEYKNTTKQEQTHDNMGETILDMLVRITGLSGDQLTSFDHKTLLRYVYNGLNSDSTYEHMSHQELLKEAHSLCSKLIAGEGVAVDTKVILDGTYRTFEFGELNNSNCTAEKLLYLVRKYPDVWLKRIR